MRPARVPQIDHREREEFVTGNALAPDLQAFIDETKAALLRKPFQIQEMLELVQDVLADRRQRPAQPRVGGL